MARLTAPTGPVGDLVDDYLTSPATRQMHLYADMAGTQNPATRAAAALRRGDAAVVDSSALPHEVAAEFFDPRRLTHVRVRLQRGHAPQVVDDTTVVAGEHVRNLTADDGAAVPDGTDDDDAKVGRDLPGDDDEPTVATQPMEVDDE